MIEATPEIQDPGPRTLPGDRATVAKIGPMIRVNQAGELGAKEIYRGQLAVLKDHPCAPVLAEMAEQESEHLAAFDKLIAERGVRPTALSPVWRLAGYTLGAGSALLGERAAMATTVAVEDVIEEHYQRQLDALDNLDEGDEAELRKLIAEFRADELKHREMALEYGAKDAPAYQILSRSVKSGTRLAIWLAERV